MRFPYPIIANLLDAQRNFEALGAIFHVGTGNPNGQVIASPPALYLNDEGGAGATLFVKESGVNTNTGWTAK